MAEEGEVGEKMEMLESEEETDLHVIDQTDLGQNSGIIYLSRIPTHMSVKKVRQVFNEYGEVGRIFLQPDERAPKYKKNRGFTEGWVEFAEKKVAKVVARSLNNQQVGGKRHARWYEEIWNIKYLPKFKWGHLNERLAYERAVHKQRLRTEVAQVKRQTNRYIQNVEKRKVLERLEKKKKSGKVEVDVATDEQSQQRPFVFHQNKTEDEVLSRRKKNLNNNAHLAEKKVALDKDFLKNLFS